MPLAALEPRASDIEGLRELAFDPSPDASMECDGDREPSGEVKSASSCPENSPIISFNDSCSALWTSASNACGSLSISHDFPSLKPLPPEFRRGYGPTTAFRV